MALFDQPTPADQPSGNPIATIGGDSDRDALRSTDPRIAAAYAYWRQKSAGRSMPRRADLDPTEIPSLLPDLMLVDVLEGGRYRYRLIGTANAREQGVNATGRYLDEVLPGADYKAHVIALYDECVQSRRALYSECLFMGAGQQTPERHTKLMLMPLSADGASANMVLVIQVYLYVEQTTRARHFLDVRPYKEIAHVLL